MVFSKYNKGRPFLSITQHVTPAKGENTSIKNWGKKGKKILQETVSIIMTVKNKHLLEATVIIDILQRRIIKSRFEEPNEEVVTHYLSQYKKEIAEGIQVWMNQQYSNKEEAEEFMKKLDDEINWMDKPITIESEDNDKE